MIFHVTEPRRWERSLLDGRHTGSTWATDLADEGFIHCSTAEQWPGVVERFYGSVPALVLLHIDEQRLSSPLVWEGAQDVDDAFPHVYGPIDLDAVVRVETIRGHR
jgi:uncharacterized protein (DUF952 family)